MFERTLSLQKSCKTSTESSCIILLFSYCYHLITHGVFINISTELLTKLQIVFAFPQFFHWCVHSVPRFSQKPQHCTWSPLLAGEFFSLFLSLISWHFFKKLVIKYSAICQLWFLWYFVMIILKLRLRGGIPHGDIYALVII